MHVEVDSSHREPIIEATLLLLAGGRSRRMGRPKAELPVAGTTLLEWQLDRLGPSFAETLVSAAGQLAASRPVVVDRRPGAGPVAALEAGLAAAANDLVFVLACDMPDVPAELAVYLATRIGDALAAAAVIGGEPEPVCALYRKAALPLASRELNAGRLRAGELLTTLDARLVTEAELAVGGFGPELFTNLNTPADFEAFVRRRTR